MLSVGSTFLVPEKFRDEDASIKKEEKVANVATIRKTMQSLQTSVFFEIW